MSGGGPSRLLVSQVGGEEESLARALRLLDTAHIDDRVRAAVKVKFETLFTQRLREVGVIREAIPASGDGGGLGRSWRSLRRAHEKNQDLLRSYLGFLQGALLRAAALDGGICELADRLLGELGTATGIPWTRVAILGEGEMFEVSTEIVKLRFPQIGMWRLPLMAHEFGHKVVSDLEVLDPSGLRKSKPLQELADSVPGSEVKLRELCSDVFAVYVLGPAYACNAILLEWDPEMAYEEPEGAAHPSDAKRAHVVLAALARLDDPRNRFNRPLGDVAGELGRLWAAGRAESRVEPELPPEVAAKLDVTLERVWTILTRHLPTAAYDNRRWGRARTLATALTTRDDPAGALTVEDRIGDVLNAAWAARLSEGDLDVEEVDTRATALAWTVSGGGHG